MFYSQDEEELILIGQKIGSQLVENDVLVLVGELGAGKTTLTKGIALGLDISQMIKSPTYTIVREYEGRLPLYHLDVYRIGDDPDSIDLDDFVYGNGVCVIEWGNLLANDVLSDYLEIVIKKTISGRDIELIPHGEQSKLLIERIESD
ncbi:MAG: tRNA (adenosine(37)-N6)-threonylcarbamoyltransferase complex ATPase subunit type 1 TsaE [Streptococcus sp.]|nr:tRNA (adenosine(37)-N6)-threonylcarbamoyltransferase complex ATPase subunit type 1 TsaE [Streptococcus sp.]